MKKLFSTREIEGIYSGANSAVWYSHQHARAQAKKHTREEDFVATLVTDGVPLLAERWARLLEPKGISIRVSGVFCHGHPQVAFGSPRRRIELADLLIVHQHIGRKKAFSRAILLQAKTSTDGTVYLKSNDSQLELYSTWPAFEFVTGGLRPGLRNFGKNSSGSRYVLVLNLPQYPEEIDWPDQCPWATSKTTRNLEADTSLAKLLGNILLFQDGRPFSLHRPRSDWSKTIKELLQVTGSKTYRRSNLGRGDTPRGSYDSEGLVLNYAGSHAFPIASGFLSSSRMPILEKSFDVAMKTSEGDQNMPPIGLESPDEQDPSGVSSLIIETFDPERD
ncbi:hypothetical protein [Vibrio parahaemolyticus]|uniref:hypothetical protein n=1 Tax=Vibrio parahaemolyticus TaxID=670 RepID=UPI00235F04EC|nr:hypothetical protein [Vibrio parahaemolyticus]